MARLTARWMISLFKGGESKPERRGRTSAIVEPGMITARVEKQIFNGGNWGTIGSYVFGYLRMAPVGLHKWFLED